MKNSENHFFSISARVLQHLGSELISSDDTALYELVKNGFDAGSRTVEIRVVYRFDYAIVTRIIKLLSSLKKRSYSKSSIIKRLRSDLGSNLVKVFEDLNELLPKEGRVQDFIDVVRSANSISVCDAGSGMTKDELISNFLTIGTPNRLHQFNERSSSNQNDEEFTVFGEKGIGRLSAMRLGSRLQVITKNEKDVQWLVDIDWNSFANAFDQYANEIPVQITKGVNSPDSGTVMKITDLLSEWSQQKVEALASHFFSRFIDPFTRKKRFRVNIYWNKELINIPRIGKQFLKVAQNSMKGEVVLDEKMRYKIIIKEKFTTISGIEKDRVVEYTEFDFPDISENDLKYVGPFQFELYHYNRRRVSSITGVATRREVLHWLDEWCGGLKVYRDGIRVLPYGQMGRDNSREKRTDRISESYDDWLGIDDRALRAKGLTLNRIQTVGCVRLSRQCNPHLIDQSNRQGLIENRAFGVFQELLIQLINLFRFDIMEVQDPSEADIDSIKEKSMKEEEVFADCAEQMISAINSGDHKQVKESKEKVLCSVRQLRKIIEETQNAADDQDFNRIEVLELAGLGLSAQSFAHDLEASIDEVLSVSEGIDSHLKSVFRALRVQVALIKPGAAKKRRKRGRFIGAEVLNQIAAYHKARLTRHGINLIIKCRNNAEEARLFMVEGHFRQIIDNLVRNSLYWLPRKRSEEQGVVGDKITLTLDGKSKTLSVSDNGPGIAPQDKEWVFMQFRTRKKAGKGLGLYIARELAEFNGASIVLNSKRTNSLGRFTTFIIDLNEVWEK